MFNAMKLGMLLLYAASIAAWVVGGDAIWVVPGQILGPATLAVHVLEFGFYVPHFKKKDRELGPEVAQLLLFGVIHFFSLPKR